MSKQYPISHITNGQATTEKFNKPIRLILAALNDISSRLDGMNNKSAVLQWDAVVSSDAALGDLVYFDSENGSCFRPALARLSGEPGSQGQSVLAPSSRVLGLLISTAPVVILRSGYYESSVITATIGVGALAGLYYLSPSVAGKATMQPGWNMRQPCISYYGDGKFSMITNYLAHDNHHHTYTKLTLFTIANSYTGSDSTQGSYVWIVDTAATGELSPETSVVFYKGQLASSDLFKIGRLTVWYTGLDTPDAPVYLFNVFPFAYGDSVVRSIGTSTLQVNANSGAVLIDIKPYQKLAAQQSATAVSNIAGNTMSFTPVVSKIIPSSGIYAANLGEGKYVLASSKLLGVPLMATLMYMNGTQRVATSLLTYTVFPKSVLSSSIISMPILNNTGLLLKIYIWLQAKADAACDMYTLLYWIPLLELTAVQIPTNPIASGRIAVSLGSANSLVYKEQPMSATISTSGTLVAKISAMPTDDIYIYHMGFKVLAMSGSLENLLPTTTDLDTAIMQNIAKVLTYNASY